MRSFHALLKSCVLVPFLLGLGGPSLRADPESYGLAIVIDGAQGDLFRRYAEQGKLPNVKKLFLDQGVWVEHTSSPFPTITGAGMPAVLTGCVPGRHGLPSLYFFDRKTRQYPVLYVPLEALTWNKWLSPDVKTIWEHFPGPNDALSMGPALSRGADETISITYNIGYQPMEVRAKLKIFRRRMERVLSREKPARLTVLYNGWFDHMEHTHGATSAAMDPHYAAVDQLIGEAVEVFENTVKARERKIGHPCERYVTLVSDHGHQDIRAVYSIDEVIRGQKGARVLDKVWKQVFGQKLSGQVPENLDDREIVVAAGEGHALLYFPTPVLDPTGRSVVRLDWSKRPGLALLRNYPFRTTHLDVIHEAVDQKATAFIVVKDWESGTVHVVSKAGEATLERQGTAPTRSNYRYTVIQGGDPLAFTSTPAVAPLVDGAFHSADEWQLATALTEYPDAAVQLYQAFDHVDRSPDMYLSAGPYISIGDLVESAGVAGSKHGGLTKEEAWATLAFHGTRIRPARVFTARNIDMVPTMLRLLGQPYDPAQIDGRVVPEIEAMLTAGADAAPAGTAAVEAQGDAELARILALPPAQARVALLGLATRPAPALRTATRARARAMQAYEQRFSSPWYRSAKARSAAAPTVPSGLVQTDSEEVKQHDYEIWRTLFARIERQEASYALYAPAALTQLFAAGSPAQQSYDAVVTRIDQEQQAFKAWKDSTFVTPRHKAQLKAAYEALVARTPTRDELERTFLATAFPGAPAGGARVMTPAGPGFEELPGGP